MREATYRLYLSLILKVMAFAFPAFFLIVGVFILIVEQEPFLLLVLGALIWPIYSYLSIPHTITVTAQGRIELRGLIRKRYLRPAEIESIKPVINQPGFLVLKHSGGKVTLLNQFDGFHRFLTDLENANPSIEMRGC